jgi:hypothetical protein
MKLLINIAKASAIASVLFLAGCASVSHSKGSICHIPFDYADDGLNAQNVKGLLLYYCLCVDEEPCTK